MGKMKQKIWYSIMVCESKSVEISMIGYVYTHHFLGVDGGYVGVLEDTIGISISGRIVSESAGDSV